MTKIITTAGIEHLSVTELSVKLFQLAQELYHTEQDPCRRMQIQCSIETIQRVLIRKRLRVPKM
jgi:hypothetical protein